MKSLIIVSPDWISIACSWSSPCRSNWTMAACPNNNARSATSNVISSLNAAGITYFDYLLKWYTNWLYLFQHLRYYVYK